VRELCGGNPVNIPVGRQLRDDTEVLLVIKTSAARYGALEALLQARHPYEMPEIIALPVVAGAADYLNWIRQATSP